MNSKNLLWDEIELESEPKSRPLLDLLALAVVVILIVGLVVIWASMV